MLKAANVAYRIGNKILVDDINIELKTGEFTVIMGQNGAGKSTLLRILSGSIKPTEGEVMLNNKKINEYGETELAKLRAVLSQHYDITFPLIASEIVMMGRYPHFKSSPSVKDKAVVSEVMEMMNVQEFSERIYNTLSGGEAQKIQMARVLSQIWDSNLLRALFLDEPVSSLDLHYQHTLLKTAKDFSSKNTLVVAILHDINLALAYADRIIFMKDGRIVKDSGVNEVLSEELLEDVFNINAGIISNPITGKPIVVVKS